MTARSCEWSFRSVEQRLKPRYGAVEGFEFGPTWRSTRNRLPIMVWSSSAMSGPDITILTPKGEVFDRSALRAS